MANDKNFVVKNSVEIDGNMTATIGTVTNNNVDLSTGNYFVDTPRGASTYTFSNPANAQSFQLELTGGTAEVAQSFSTTLYQGNGGTQTITNNIDLANDGGLVWIKGRDGSAPDHELFDTERGVLKELRTNSTNDENTLANSVTAFNSDGFTMGGALYVNGAGTGDPFPLNYVSWTFKKEPGFFDIVTYTGNGTAGRTISHNIGTTVGTIIIKRTDTSSNWVVYHRGNTAAPETDYLSLNTTDATSDLASIWFDTAPTDTEFTLGDQIWVNASGGTYVAYLFAHDPADDGLIQCGSYTGTGATGNAVNLGWQPQWVIIKRTDTTGQWRIFDDQRGVITDGFDNFLLAESSLYELNNSEDSIDFTSTGFTLKSNNSNMNASGGTYVYIAIRAASDPDVTWPAAVQWTGGSAPTSPAVGETDTYTFTTDDGGTSYIGVQSADNLS